MSALTTNITIGRTIKTLFNPDGRLKPLVGYGYFYDPISGKFMPYGMAGMQLNLIRF